MGNYGSDGTIEVPNTSIALTIAKIIEETLTLNEGAGAQHVEIKDETNIIEAPLGMNFKTLNTLLNCSQTPKYHSAVEGAEISANVSSTFSLLEDENTLVATGDTVTVGTKVWTFSVRGDVDGDAKLTVNDIGAARMHFIGKTKLAGVYLEAIENDNVEGINVNDIGRLKLAFIHKIDDLYSDLKAEE